MDRRRAARNAAVGVIQTLLSGLLMFVFYRLLYRDLGAAQLGIWSVVLASTGAARIAELGFTGSAVKYAAGRIARGDRHEAALVIETTVVTVAVALGALLPLVYVALSAALPWFVDPSGLADARALLPYACGSLWMAAVAGALQSGLDGCGRMDQRNAVALAAQVAYITLGVWWMQSLGLVGLALAQMVQGGITAVATWGLVRRALPESLRVPARWRASLFREMLGYSAHYQGLGAIRLLYEPTTKALLSRYGGLEATGVYEVASLAVTKLRALLVAAQQALTPEVAGLAETAPQRLRDVYGSAAALNTLISIPTFAVLWASTPLLSYLLLGEVSAAFVGFSALLAAGWFANSLTGPAFFLMLGTGEMKGVLWSHVTIGVANAILGIVLGRWLGGMGVALAWALALALGAAHLLREARSYRRARRPADRVTGVAVAGLATSIAATGLFTVRPDLPGLLLGAPAVAAAVLGLALWQHPLRHRLTDRLRSSV